MSFLWIEFSGSAIAQITVNGIADTEVYADKATFTVPTVAGYDYTVLLDGVSKPAGVAVDVTDVEYHELLVKRKNRTTGVEESLTTRFIVRSSERGDSEWGLPPWVPYPMIPSAAAEFAGSHLKIVAPSEYPQGLEIPVVAWVLNGEGARVGANGLVKAPEHPGHSLQLLRGVGSAYLPAAAAAGPISYTARIQTLETPKTIAIEASTSWRAVSGNISTATDWGENARISVTGTVTVAQGATLTIGAGSVIKLASRADIEVDGTIIVNGTQDRPVVFAPAQKGVPWGGFIFWNTATPAFGTFNYAILTGGCADPNWFPNHSGSGGTHLPNQALVYVSSRAEVTMNDTYLLDSNGQAGHGETSYITWNRCLLERFLTGGEYNGCHMSLTGCAVIEFPNESTPFADDDGDAIYFTGGMVGKDPADPFINNHYTLKDCLVGWAHDDGVDSGSGSGGKVRIDHCWIESDYHEALAWSSDSGAREPTITDTVIMNCGQGIESGWGTPNVNATHCLSTANSVGARFGDNYDWDYFGYLKVYDSYLLYNHRDVWGREWDSWTDHYLVNDGKVTLQGCTMTMADPIEGSALWNPAANASALDPFRPTPAGTVGIGIAVRETEEELSKVSAGVPVRLSTFSLLSVSVDYAIENEEGPMGSGTLTFDQGETVKKIQVPDPGSHNLVRVELKNPANAEITGIAEVSFIRTVNLSLIPAGSRWKYHDKGVTQGTAWRAPDFADTTWSEGPAQLGFGDGDEKTVINGGPDGSRFPTVYFRKKFDLADPGQLRKLTVRILRDDGAVVYLNGAEVYRTNMPTGDISFSTWASGATSSENSFRVQDIPMDSLVPGTNTVAVEIHQSDADSSDLSFDLELLGAIVPAIQGSTFVRGDANKDGSINISDAIKILFYLFASDLSDCMDALDANDSGLVDLSDVVYLLNYMFIGGPPLPAPFPAAGDDPTEDGLGCQ